MENTVTDTGRKKKKKWNTPVVFKLPACQMNTEWVEWVERNIL